MKKTLIIWLFCFVGVYSFGQNFCMYLYTGEKLCYEISASKMLLKSEALDVTNIINALQNTEIGSLKEIEDLGGCLFLVEMQNTNKENIWNLVRQLNAREDVIFASPVFGHEMGPEGSGYSNEVIVRLKSEDDYPILQKYAEIYHIKDVEYVDLLYAYILTLPHNPQKDAMQTALELYETGLFLYAEPNLFYIRPWGGANNTLPYKERQLNHIYPNPASNVLYVDLDKMVHPQSKIDVSYDILLYNSQGQLLRQVKVKDGIVQFNVSDLSIGIYFLHIYDGISATFEAFKVFVKH